MRGSVLLRNLQEHLLTLKEPFLGIGGIISLIQHFNLSTMQSELWLRVICVITK